MKYRVTTVQFAIPADDPVFYLTELRDQLQETLFDQEGWSGSFKIIGAQDYGDADGESCDHFQRTQFLPGLVDPNASNIIATEVLAERTARAWGWKVEETATGKHLVNKDLDRIRAPHDWIGACEDIDVRPGAFPTRFMVDGHVFDDPETERQADGQFGPFVIFDSLRQENLFGLYDTREEAQQVVDKMNADYQDRAAKGTAQLVGAA